MSTVIDNLAAKERQRTAAATAAYKNLIVACASGNEPSEDDIAAVLDAADKSAFDLSREVEVVRRRREQQAELIALVAEENRIPELRKQVADSHAEYERAKAAAVAFQQPLLDEIRIIQDRVRNSKIRLERELRDGCPDETILAKEAAIAKALHENEIATGDADDRLHRASSELGSGKFDGDQNADTRKVLTARLERATADVERLKRERTELIAQREEIELARINA
jgi:hypothetical protein